MKKKRILSLGLAVLFLISGCGSKKSDLNVIDDDYRTTYEIFVYSFCDSDGDGIGDLKGVIQKLDYINDGNDKTDDDLGCNQIWLMPICPSPTYHKYDVTDYCDIDPQYGSIDDYKELLTEAHKRGIRVINDMVMNHTSSSHPWFREATEYLKSLPSGTEPNSAECKYFDYYNFSKENQTGYTKLAGTDWYYESRFWSEMPDLNLDNTDVQNEFRDIAKFWLDLGCDGFRMDAVTSFTTDNTEKSVAELKVFNDNVKELKSDAYIVAEAWESSAVYSKYYGSGIESLFDFDFSGSEGYIAKCARGKMAPARYLEAQTSEAELFSSYNNEYVNAPFYTNHDMARSAGYYTGKTAKTGTKFAGALNLLMSGNAYIYYGEELGMKGSGKDENKRAPMIWSDDSSAEGMCKGPQDMDKIEMSNGSYETQKDDPDSIYNYYKKAIKLRNKYPAIARGNIQILDGLTQDRSAVWIKEIPDDMIAGIKESTKKDLSNSSVMLAINNSSEDIQIDLSADSAASGYRTLADSLETGETKTQLDGDTLTLPAFGIAVITK